VCNSASQRDAFVAYHGSWNRSEKAGYCVTRVRFEDGIRGTRAGVRPIPDDNRRSWAAPWMLPRHPMVRC